MKVKLGDKVTSDAFGQGNIVAMSKDWCVYDADNGSGEVALPWSEIYIDASPAAVDSTMKEKDMGEN
jgi:hypothetical protein